MSAAIRGQLDALAELMAQEDVIRLEKGALKAAILTEEIKQQLADIDLEFMDQEETVKELIALAREQVKAAVILHEASVRGERMTAVYTRPRSSWDGRKLVGYAQAHPEILAFRSFGAPSVSFRKV